MPEKKRPEPNVISLTRVYDASVERVWDAWVVPEQVAEWWGPRGFTLTTHAKDVRVGGTWRYTMHGPDGKDYENITTFLEVVPRERLVYDHGATAESGPLFRVTVTFSEADGRTTMELEMALPTPEQAAATRAFVKQAGGNATWDRLAEVLAKRASDRECFVINRTFAAPVDVLFDMWVEPKHMAEWLAPAGFTMELRRGEVRVGSTAFACTRNEAGVIMYGTTTYLEIDRPRRLVYLQRFADEHGNVARHPLAPAWPETMRTVVDFTPEGPVETRITLTWEPEGDVTREGLDVFVGGRTGMTGGWTGSFDQLEAALAARSGAPAS